LELKFLSERFDLMMLDEVIGEDAAVDDEGSFGRS
jgi:hypothetical protein